MLPWNETLSAEQDCSLLNAQSWNKIKQIKHIVITRATLCNDCNFAERPPIPKGIEKPREGGT